VNERRLTISSASLLTLTLAAHAHAHAHASAAHGVATETPRVDETCTADALFAEARVGLTQGSPALQKYLRSTLRDAALLTSDDVLLRELARTEDPAMIEALGSAIAHKAETVGSARLVSSLLKRAAHDPDPAQRAAAVRALKGTGSVELMRGAGAAVDYNGLIRDEAPEVRSAVVENLVIEDDDVYSGHSAEFAEAAFEAAAVASDKAAAARIIGETSSENVSVERARALSRLLDDDDPAMRKASARALGGVSPMHAADALSTLVARYRSEDDLDARREMLASIARLERVRAIPVLESLRSVDGRLVAEVDAWITVLRMGLPEWNLIEREKTRH
jgi:hypothetical protein